MRIYRKNKKFYASSHLVYKCCYHVIFCLKYRHNILKDNVSKRLEEICFEVAKTYDFMIEEIETDQNHIHMIINCNPRFGIMSCVSRIKSITAKSLFLDFPIPKSIIYGVANFGAEVYLLLQ